MAETSLMTDATLRWSGVDTRDLRQCEAETIVVDSDVAEEKRAALRLHATRGLAEKAWSAVEHLFDNQKPLKADDGHKLVDAELEKFGKAEAPRKQLKFNELFERIATTWSPCGRQRPSEASHVERSFTVRPSHRVVGRLARLCDGRAVFSLSRSGMSESWEYRCHSTRL